MINSIYVCIMNRKMDIHEILEIFVIPNLSNIAGESNITGESSEDLDNSPCSESVLCSSDEDVKDIYTSLYGCNFDDETAVDYYY